MNQKVVKAIAKQLTDNAFCATGPGGGVDPTCGKEEGSGGKPLTGLAKTSADAGRRLGDGSRVKFRDGEYKGYSAKVTGIIPNRYRKSDITYRLQVDGFPKPGGWDGGITATADTLMRFADELSEQ
jgi:hypothetical protein